MGKVLGLDLGTNSIGWALINKVENKLIDAGSRVFPEGVNREKGREVSKNEDRRLARQRRRLYFRKSLRKQKLVQVLMPLGMFPQSAHFLSDVQQLVLEEELLYFFRMNPYELRAKAAEGHKLSLLELGRIFYQFSQRRGYKENLQSPLDEKSDLNTGEVESGKIGIEETIAGIGGSTLGSYLSKLNPHIQRIRNRYTTRKMYLDEFELIWSKQASHYPNVLTGDLKTNLGDPVIGVLFFQRPLRSQAHLRGKCSLEPSKDRIADSAPIFELYRMFSFINNIKSAERDLNFDERSRIIELFISHGPPKKFDVIRKKIVKGDSNIKLNFDDDVKIPQCKTISLISDALGKIERKQIISQLSNQSVKDVFDILPRFEQIWKLKREARNPEWLQSKLYSDFGIEPEEAKKLVKSRFSNDFASLSHKAILNILPYTIQGHTLSDAVILGGVRNVFGSKWESIAPEQRTIIEDNVLSVAYTDKNELALDKVKSILSSEFKAPMNRLRKLYHASDYRQRGGIVKRQEVGAAILKIKNPIVQSVLFEVKALVEDIIKHYGEIDEIKIEMARDLKKSKKLREKEQIQIYKNERENDECRALLNENNLKPSGANLLKMKLWRECNRTCPYSGETIGLYELFETNKYQVEHIIPYSISLDDSLANKTLCKLELNQEKGNRTPFEAFGKTGQWEAMKDRAFKLMPYIKAKRFVDPTRKDLEDFIERQINDTRYISRECSQLLNAYAKTSITQGGLTAILRRSWGLNDILNPRQLLLDEYKPGRCCAAFDEKDQIIEDTLTAWVKDFKLRKKIEDDLAKKGKVAWGMVRKQFFYPEKSRLDHRHHAVDAITIAFSSTSLLQEISKLSGQGAEVADIDIELPWNSFHSDCRRMIDSILVSHKNRRRVISNWRRKLFDKTNGKLIIKNDKQWYGSGIASRDQLHKDTYYGLYTQKDGTQYLHNRVALESRKKKKLIEEVVDPGVRQAIYDRLKAIGVDTDQKDFDVPTESADNPVFFSTDADGKKVSLVFMPNKNAEPIPIKKVRIRGISKTKIQLHGINRYVEPGNNHHVLIYRDHNTNLNSSIITFWEAVERTKQKTPLFQLPADGAESIAVLMKNHLFILGYEGEIDWNDQRKLKDYLYRVQKLSDGDWYFRKHNASTLDFEVEEVRVQSLKAWNKLSAKKVILNRLGKIIQIID